MSDASPDATTAQSADTGEQASFGRHTRRPLSLRAFLANLTPLRAFVVFTISFAVGCVVIVARAGGVWVPTGVVLCYGLVLLYSQRRHLVYLPQLVKDSPYYLGFLFTLVALAIIFVSMIGDDAVLQDANVDLVVEGVGVALLTTIAGLFMRQLVHSTDPATAIVDDQYRSVMDQLREHASTFAASQRQLVNLIDEFTSTRERDLQREQRVSREFVGRMDAAAKALAQVEADYVEKVAELSEAVGRAVDQLDEQGRYVEKRLDDMGRAIRATLDEQAEGHRKLAESTREAEIAVREELNRRLEEVRTHTRASVRAAEEALEGLVEVGRAHRSAGAELAASLAEVDAALKSSKTRLDEVEEALGAVMRRLRTTPEQIGETFSDLDREIQVLHRAVHEIAETVRSDAEAIDAALTDVSRLLEHRFTRDL